jgi:hypothetical protein
MAICELHVPLENNKILRMKFYKLVSYMFHPILVPIIGTIIFFILLPRHTSRTIETTIIVSVFIATYALPLVLLSILKQLKVIDNYHLSHTHERKYPLFFYIPMVYLMATLIKNNPATIDLALFFYGSTISLFVAILLIYKNLKASLHMIGISGILTFIIIFSYLYEINSLFIISMLFIISGVVATSRLHLKAHTKKEVCLGFLIGFLGQIITYLTHSI